MTKPWMFNVVWLFHISLSYSNHREHDRRKCNTIAEMNNAKHNNICHNIHEDSEPDIMAYVNPLR